MKFRSWSRSIGSSTQSMTVELCSQLSAYPHSEEINNKRVREILAKTVFLHQRKSQTVVVTKHLQTSAHSNRYVDRAPVEFVHITAKRQRIDDICTSIDHDNNQL